MRRWVVEQRLVAAEPERVAALLVDRMHWVRTPLAGSPGNWLDLAVRVQAGPPGFASLVMLGAYPVPRGITGAVVDALPLRAEAAHVAARVLDELTAEILAVLAPLPGIAPFGEPTTRPVLVHDLMDPDVPAVDADMDLPRAAALLTAMGVDGAPVVDGDGRLLGMLSERDLLAGLLRPADGEPLTAGDLCTRPAVVTVPGLSVDRAARQMLYHRIRRLAVVQEGRLVGTVTRRALFEALRAEAADNDRRAPTPA